MPLRRYAIRFALVTGLAFGGAVAFNYAVDPYDFDIAPGRSVPPEKRETGSHGRLHKAYALMNLRPTVVALGASRTEAAIDMSHPGWAGAPGERYNASVTAANLREIRALLGLAAASATLKQVLIGLEFYSFNAFVPNRPDFDPALMAGRPKPMLGFDPGKARYYFSMDALRSSVKTLTERHPMPHFLLDGRVNPEALEGAYHGSAGQRSAFLDADRESLQIYYTPPPRRVYSFTDETGASMFDQFREILAFARRNHVDLRLYISPAHARSSEALHLLGLDERYEEWQRTLVRILAEEAAASGGPAFPLWDFGGYSAITTEAVPADDPAGPRSAWYWESSHYRVELGNLVLDRIFDHHEPGRTMPADFGVRLSADDLDAVQRRAREGRARYRSEHAAEIAEIRAQLDPSSAR